LIDRDSLCWFYGLKITEKNPAPGISEESLHGFNVERTPSKSASRDLISSEDFRNFTKVLDRMVNQHSEERQNFMRLVNTLQEKIFILENQVNLLKTPAKKWYQIWK